MTPTVIVVCKTPVAGRVKTRLCPPCSPKQAAEIARAAIAQTMSTVEATGHRRVLLLDGDPGWVPRGWDVIPQPEGGLDDRLAHGFAQVAGPAVLIGMDTPQITPSHLEQALKVAADGGVAIGPTLDGGWWSLSAGQLDPQMVLGVKMSSDQTYDLTVARLRELGHNPVVLEKLNDVDTWDDALDVATQLPSTQFSEAVASVSGWSHD